MQIWQEKELDDGALLRGALLVEAERWFADQPDELSREEKTYIREGITLRERERQAVATLEKKRNHHFFIIKEETFTNYITYLTKRRITGDKHQFRSISKANKKKIYSNSETKYSMSEKNKTKG